MSFLSLCSTVNELATHADELPRVDELLTMLQQCFITVFKPAEPSPSGNDSGAAEDSARSTPKGESPSGAEASSSFASHEEERLMVVHAVRSFHERGVLTHRDFFHSPSYHPHAALFIHGLLQSLGGHSRLWFRALQLACVTSCASILRAIGIANVRLCLPGVVSAAARYLSRAHTRTDSVQVKVAVMDLLRETLNAVFTMPDPSGSAWTNETIAHLGGVMHVILTPDAVLESARDVRSAVSIKRLTMELLTTPSLAEHMASPFARELVVAYAIASNLVDLEFATPAPMPGADASYALAEDRPGSVWATLRLPDTVWDSTAAVDAVIQALETLRGVALLHVATSIFCMAALRPRVLTADAGRQQLLASVVRKCVRLVGTEMPVESLYGSRDASRPPVAQVVDRFLECCAHACAILPNPDTEVGSPESHHGNVDDSEYAGTGETPGEALSNLLLDEYETILQDWDLYMAHPPALYVITRLILWQFKPLTGSIATAFITHKGSGSHNDGSEFPSPPQFVTTRAFENLWSVVAPPHLWNITEDEELCRFQQIRHRHVVAATLLRFLGLAARDVLAPARTHYGDEGAYSWERFRTLTLYLVLEKEAVAGPVHEAASACLREYAAASGDESALAFFLGASHVVLEEASRGVREAFLRPSVASVLRGVVDVVVAGTRTPRPSEARGSSSDAEPSPTATTGQSHTQVAVLVRQRLSVAEATATVARHGGLRGQAVNKVAECLTAAIRVATESCQRARREGDAAGMKGAVILLRDCFDVATLISFTSPLLPEDEDHERQVTSANQSVQQLQAGVVAALQLILTNCMSHSQGTCVPFAVQAAIRALTVFIDTQECATWAEHQRAAIIDAVAARRAEKADARSARRRPLAGLEEEAEEEEEESEAEIDVDRAMQLLPLPALPWPWMSNPSVDAHDEVSARLAERQVLVLPRSHLKTVYRVYLSLVALLKEPVAAFHTAAARPGRRSPVEQRALQAIRITPSIFTVLDAIESLWDLAGDFMSNRAVEEVLPLGLVWYERATLPRIPTDTEVRLAQCVRRFAQRLAKVVVHESSKAAVAKACAPWFTVSVTAAESNGAGDASDSDAAAAQADGLPAAEGSPDQVTDAVNKLKQEEDEEPEVYVGGGSA